MIQTRDSSILIHCSNSLGFCFITKIISRLNRFYYQKIIVHLFTLIRPIVNTRAIFKRTMKKKTHKHTLSNGNRRLSLKSLATTKLKSQISRPSIAAPRKSLTKSPKSVIHYSQTTCTERPEKLPVKRQTIINNLVSKLNHDQDDLKTIISAKLKDRCKNKSNGFYFLATEDYPIPTNYHTPVECKQEQVLVLKQKIRNYENQIQSYKKMVQKLSERLCEMNRNDCQIDLNCVLGKQNIDLKHLKGKKTTSIGIQVSEKDKINVLSNFYHNIDNTLKVLNRN